MLCMEWYLILTLVLSVVSTLLALFITYKVRIITNFKTLFDGVKNEKDLEAIADLLNISVDVVLKLISILGIKINLGSD